MEQIRKFLRRIGNKDGKRKWPGMKERSAECLEQLFPCGRHIDRPECALGTPLLLEL